MIFKNIFIWRVLSIFFKGTNLSDTFFYHRIMLYSINYIYSDILIAQCLFIVKQFEGNGHLLITTLSKLNSIGVIRIKLLLHYSLPN